MKVNKILINQKINVREYRISNEKWKIQRNWQDRVNKIQEEHKHRKNPTQYMLDTTMLKLALVSCKTGSQSNCIDIDNTL